MRSIACESLVIEAFAPFGEAFRCLPQPGRSEPVSTLMSSHMKEQAPRLTLSHLVPATAPVRLDRLERHPHSTQSFIPMMGSSYIAVVASSLKTGMPDLANIRAFKVDGDMGITYGANVWHGSMIGLSGPTQMAVLMWRTGQDDDVFTVLDEAIEVSF